ncbi:fimbrial protein [Pseudomonas sp. FW215-R2]|jgi:major type 1 subunit fimbrin (pilin)|uniref:fimbrial protein n=1 Tax=unclassified Pseudomonas TaxID=196821 RepID=UPI000BD1FC03|nr:MULTISPECIES: fimbrial protein [unclassified Pseudomonas]PCR95772.1 fimbrial protein [Pseudomonas fluorescens]PMW96231.1 fimbrial protein [Pseudomonas sp. FW215-R2]PMX06388.1 fimbrial protein [Pseudomonas sp. FW215-L1]PMX19559.1 fimbrial protein [Pseudomonas sp. FW215-E1]PNA25235.1 fimbrial protein [Pseudomonas sp. FW215-R4]
MKKFTLAFLTLSILSATGNAFAADPVVPTKAGSGTINFSGIINNDACSVQSSDLNKTISVPMGEVSIKDMGTAAAPIGSGKLSAENFDMKITCNKGTKVSMIFQPKKGAGSGLVEGTKVLKLIDGLGAAKNIGIALLDANGALIDLSSDATAHIENTLQDGGTTLKFSAAYVTTGPLDTVVAGRGDATLPFVLQYE